MPEICAFRSVSTPFACLRTHAEWTWTMSEIPLRFPQHSPDILELFSLLTQPHYGTAQGKTINQFPSLPCL